MPTDLETSRGADGLLEGVIGRLRDEARVDLRVAKEDFSRDLADLRRRVQISLAVLLGALVAVCGAVIVGTYVAVRGVLDDAGAQVQVQAVESRRLQQLEEQTAARLESLTVLERRLRVRLLEQGDSPVEAPDSGKNDAVGGSDSASEGVSAEKPAKSIPAKQ